MPWYCVSATSNPQHELLQRELFGPILTVFPYPDSDWGSVLDLVDRTSPYALTGAVFANDRAAVDEAAARSPLRRGQLLHQRQADRRGRRSAAIRWREDQRDQRQGRLRIEHAALGVTPGHQGDVRPSHGMEVPAPGR